MNEIEAALERAERALHEGRGLGRTGFWPAVSRARSDRALAERHATRIAAIDRRAFEAGVKLRVGVGLGVVALAVATLVGVVLVIFAAMVCVPQATATLRVVDVDACGIPGVVPVAFLAGFAAIIVGSHSLAHYVVGRAVGIRFTHVFLGGPPPPRPGVKTDYDTYLRTPPRARAVMHASGAVVTKLVPFALLPVSLRLYDGWPWLTWILLAVGVATIVTDITISTKVSDWMKVRRELRSARSW